MMSFNVNELTLDNVGQWPNPIKIAVVTFMSLLLIALGYWFIAKENFEQYDTLKAQEVTLRSDFEIKQRQASNLNAYRNQLAMMEERFGNMLKQASPVV